MLRCFKSASLLALMLVVAAPAFAQGPGGGGGGRGGRGGFGGGFGGGSPYGLLSNPAVQEELALSDDQKTKVTSLVESMQEAQRGDRQPGGGENFRDLSDDERRARIETMMKERTERNAKVTAEYKPKFEEALDEVQLQRLQQISWQSQGSRALRDPEMVKALGLSQEQQDKIAKIYEENGGGFGGGRGGRGGNGGNGGGNGGNGGGNDQDREARMAEFQARMDKLNADVKGVLTDAQKTEMTNLLGAEFDVSKLRGQGGPGGNRGEGGQRRNRGPGGNGGNNNNI